MLQPDAMLCFPPVWQTEAGLLDFPVLGTPSLVGHLRAAHRVVEQWDLNAAFRQYLLHGIRYSPIQRIPLPDGLEAGTEDLNPRALQDLTAQYADTLKRQWPDLLSGLETSHGLTYEDVVESRASAIYPLVTHPQANVFHRFYHEAGVLDRLSASRPRLLGLSVLGPRQVIAAFTLAHLVRQALPDLFIVLGGPWVTQFSQALCRLPGIAQLFHAIVLGEGETPLLKLVKRLEHGHTLEGIPNLVTPASPSLPGGVPLAVEDLATLPAPDFDGFLLEHYAFRNTVTYQTSRGCYWSRCLFCEHVHGCHGSSYRTKPLALVRADIASLVTRFGIEGLMFTDAAISPRRLRDLSQALIEDGIALRWWCFARPEPQFDEALLAQMAGAGCDTIDFGLETANRRVSRLMCRGADAGTASRIFRTCRRVGIRVVVGAILRLPTETEEEALETLSFLSDHADCIDLVGLNLFNLKRGTPIALEPAQFGIEIHETPDEILRSSLRHTSSQPLSHERAADLCRKFLQQWPGTSSRPGLSPVHPPGEWITARPIVASGTTAYMAHLQLDSTPSPSPSVGVVHRAPSDGPEALDAEAFLITKPAVDVFQLCDGRHTVLDINRELSQQAGASEESTLVAARLFLDDLVARGLVCWSDQTRLPG